MTVEMETLAVRLPEGMVQVARWTPSDGPARGEIVLLHQGLGSITQWGSFPEALGAATACRVTAYDRLGYGRSDFPDDERGDFLEREAWERLPALLDALGVEQPILYGHSDGGTIALLYASERPAALAGLVSEAAHVFSEVAETGGIEALRAEFETGDLARKLARHHPRHLDRMFHRWADFWQAPGRDDWTMLERLAAIECPVLIVQGDADEHGSLRQVDEIVERVHGPAERRILPGCGHSPHREQPQAVLAAVAPFVAAILQGNRAPHT
ncbi:alpha/beta fold hydrolase [Kaistia nematophila]|uniref:Alpha/beta hydrolase n=1 Tax=Kaistia nematophila TaxID=2994654 RepID=A0A9X3E3F0_9HYPH|nr:alpha/beta hydrolase [Kaistia nematophila]MCX5570398.1 alpha/beta hydrolase [Kaistia nematophila]